MRLVSFTFVGGERTLKIERVLKPYGFVRSHRSLMVNMRYVKSVSNYLMELTTGTVWRSGAALTD